jgi:hypothetical protein
MTDLSHLLGKKTNEIEKPKPMPIGHYSFVTKSFQIVESAKKKTPGVEYLCNMVEPKDDVDEELLTAVKNPNQKDMKLTFWLTEDSLFRLKDFLTVLGITNEDDDRTLEEILPESVGQTFISAIKHETMEGQEDPFAKINDMILIADE